MVLLLCASGGTKLLIEEGSAVHKGEPNVPSLVDGQQAVWLDVSEFG